MNPEFIPSIAATAVVVLGLGAWGVTALRQHLQNEKIKRAQRVAEHGLFREVVHNVAWFGGHPLGRVILVAVVIAGVIAFPIAVSFATEKTQAISESIQQAEAERLIQAVSDAQFNICKSDIERMIRPGGDGGPGKDKLYLPSSCDHPKIKEALKAQPWIKFATDAPKQADPPQQETPTNETQSTPTGDQATLLRQFP